MEALKLKRKAERAQLTRLINEAEATLTQDRVTEEELCILNERLNRLHTDLRATDSDIVPLLSATEAEAEFDRVVEYNDRATTTSAKLKYRIRQLQESLNHALPARPTEPVLRTPQPAIQLPKIDLMKFDGQPLTCSDSSKCGPSDPPTIFEDFGASTTRSSPRHAPSKLSEYRKTTTPQCSSPSS
ncbi:hypothetical protein MTO96_015983 [Rhipicephalus appendiculatus]